MKRFCILNEQGTLCSFEGTYTIAEDGSYFTGTFKNGQPDKGTWYDKNGNIIE